MCGCSKDSLIFIPFRLPQISCFTLNWRSACTYVSEGVFLMYLGREIYCTSTYSSTILFSKDRSWRVFSFAGKGGSTQAWDSQAGSGVHITELITLQPAPPWGKQKSLLPGVVTQTATSFGSPAIDFCLSISYPATSLDSLISSNNFLGEFTIFYVLDYVTSREYFTFFFSVGCLFLP